MDLQGAIKNFEKRKYSVQYFDTAQNAVCYLCSKTKGKTVGFGDSQTIASIGLYDEMSLQNVVYNPQGTNSNLDFIHVAKKCLTAEIYITSVNAFSVTGELVNIDGTGNRIAGSLYGHEKVYFLIGINKGEDTLEKAIWRARNIAAPQNAKRLGLKTPCAIKGDRCYNCSSKDRICNALAVYYSAMDTIEAEIIFINDCLGF